MTTATMGTITAKIKEGEKSRFTETCDKIGTSPSNAIRMFVTAFNQRGGFPFDPANPYGFNEETLAAIKDASDETNLIGPFNTVEEMFDTLDEQPMLKLFATKKFKKDYKRCKKQGKNFDTLKKVIKDLQDEKQLEEKYRDHALSGNYQGSRECHIEPDFLLIYRIDNKKLILTTVRIGSHAELFGK